MKQIVLAILVTIFSVQFLTAQKKYGKVEESLVQQKEHQIEKDANATVVYRRTYTKFNYTSDKGFFLETTFHEILKIYNSEGYQWANVEIPLYKSRKAKETVKGLKGITYNMVDGKLSKTKLSKGGVFDEEKSKYRRAKKFTMPNIQDGSVIEYMYTMISPFTFNINEFVFQETIPVDEVHMVFYAPEYLNYKTHGKGWIPYDIQNETKNRKIRIKYYVSREGDAVRRQGDAREQEVEFQDKGYIVALKNVPSIKEEAYSNNINNYKSGLQFELAFTKYPGSSVEYYASTWEDVAKKIYESSNFGKEIEKKNYFKNDIETLLEGLTSSEEKLAKIYAFVKNEMTWNDYRGVYTDNGVVKAYKEKVGNVAEINLMLTSMLRYAGLDANPVLISSKSNGIPLYPSSNAYNYVVSGVKNEGKLYLLDAADKLSGINVLKEGLLNWQGRMVYKDGTSGLVNLQPNKAATHTAMLDLDFDSDLVLSGKVQNRYTGHYAREKREAFIDLKEDQVRTEIEENLNGAAAFDIKMNNLNNVYKPVTISCAIDELEAVEQIGDKIYFSPSVYLSLVENYFDSEDRKYPVDFGYSRSNKYITTITIPEGYEIESLPEPLAINMVDNLAGYRYQVSNTGNKIQLSLQRNINSPIISPLNYGDLRNFFNMIVKKENEKIVLKKI